MENTNNTSIEQNEGNLYKYSYVDLVSFIKEQNIDNNKTDSQSIKKREFLIELAIFLEKKLKHNISLHQNGFKIYKQKLLADKTFIINSIKKDLRSLTIKQLIELLTNLKNDSESNNVNPYFNIGQKISSNIDQSQIEAMNNIFYGINSSNKNENDININRFSFNNKEEFKIMDNSNNNLNKINFENKIKKNNNIHGLNIKDIIHSPSPLIFKKQHKSKIIEENENFNNKINFEEEQRI